jgi:hypothetical protein
MAVKISVGRDSKEINSFSSQIAAVYVIMSKCKKEKIGGN